MLDDLVKDISLIEVTVVYYLHFTVGIIALLIFIHILNKLSGQKLSILGVIPRHIIGLPGIFCSPFLHGNFNHLFFNSIPLFVLMNMVLVDGFNVFLAVSWIIILISGVLIWVFGRFSIHLGSSSVIMGYFGFLTTQAYMSPGSLSLILIMLCLYYFGGLVAALIPTNTKGISVEGHIFGFLAGIISFFAWPQFIGYLS